jgi:hypothetical protein
MSSAALPAAATVHEAITAVIGDMAPVGKEESDALGYAIRTIEATKAAVRPLLAAHGVHYVLDHLGHVEADTVPVGDRGKVWQRVRLVARWHIYGPAGDYVTVETLGVGVDSSDKAANKAVTAAEKQMLVTSFCVADGERDPDRDRAELGEAATWPAGAVKRGMVVEVAAQVTGGDEARATELAAIAWARAGLVGDDIPAAVAVEAIEAAVEVARQEYAADAGPAQENTTEADHGGAGGDTSSQSVSSKPPAPPWPNPAAFRRDLKARGLSSRQVWTEVHDLAGRLGEPAPAGALDSILSASAELVEGLAAWVKNHDTLDPDATSSART